MGLKNLLLGQDSVTDLFTLVYVFVDDYLKAAVNSGSLVLPKEPHQKATYSELMTIGLVGEMLGEVYIGQWFERVRTEYRALFPLLPDVTRFYRVQANFEGIHADLALSIPTIM